MKHCRPTWRRFTWWTLAVLALATTFGLYALPDVVFDMATRLWTCF
ncbi:MAG: hypothetical protein RI907_226 [Pseudomonadota bacterium]|jgi:hypothetical protein